MKKIKKTKFQKKEKKENLKRKINLKK